MEQLKREGWKVRSQYSPLAFDKGIDFDSYELVLGSSTLYMQWDNWFEWKLSGPPTFIEQLKQRFEL
ncbi:hypothetical protein DBZ36_10360 [Alginatibacterium sediminis]|uniref:Uncharacterized protein n=1 Tax=Alginatibacterium sediminis TaxID=2164068 RepID=A0A420EE07_9ALTE|nr:hypothetical protein DBZ36_10360 [Alginatibacterium sediminis]